MRAPLTLSLCLIVLAPPSAGAEPPGSDQVEDHPGSHPLDFVPERKRSAPPNTASKRSPRREGPAANTLYLELGGGGGALSLNYERLLADIFSMRVGGGLFYVQVRQGGHVPAWVSAVSFPVTVSFLGIRSGDKVLELGGGATILAPVSPESQDALRSSLGRGTTVMAVPTAIVGYRTLHGQTGGSLRFAWTPFIGPMGLNYWLGLAMGHEF